MKWVNLLFVSGVIVSNLLFFNTVFAEIAKIVFITESQNVSPNTLSDAITIQAQDVSGNKEETTETLDLVFISTSPTGEFLGSGGNPATKTMNRNTANRTFYYRDSSLGTFTITVSATGRDSGKQWSASQKISVGVGGSSSGTASSISTSNNSSASATTGSTPITKTVIDPSFEIYAGIDRLTSAGSPIAFKALIRKGDQNVKTDFSWSFGDGSVGSGVETSHTYKYPGIYAIVLNAKSGKNSALSRISVRVVEPKLKVSSGQGFVEISNKGDDEINLFNWKLVGGIRTFIFQPDTIIFPHSSVKFDAELLRFNQFEIVGAKLFDALGREVNFEDEFIALESESEIEIIDESVLEPIMVEPKIEEEIQIETKPVSTQAASVILYEAPKSERKGWWSRLIDFLFR